MYSAIENINKILVHCTHITKNKIIIFQIVFMYNINPDAEILKSQLVSEISRSITDLQHRFG